MQDATFAEVGWHGPSFNCTTLKLASYGPQFYHWGLCDTTPVGIVVSGIFYTSIRICTENYTKIQGPEAKLL